MQYKRYHELVSVIVILFVLGQWKSMRLISIDINMLLYP